MPVSAPIAHLKINFDIPADRRSVANSHHGTTKIRSRFPIPKTWMEHPDGTTIRGLELISPNSLVVPDGLNETLGWNIARGFPEFRRPQTRGSPLGVAIGNKQAHWPLLFRPLICKVKT